MAYVTSTLSADVKYTRYQQQSSGSNTPVGHVLIRGGANVANKKFAVADGILTPEGIQTHVSDDDLAFLEQDEVFQTHLKNGFVKIHRSATKVEKVVEDMTAKDKSAPITPEDMAKKGAEAKDSSITLNRIE
jgi:hypothetical protein